MATFQLLAGRHYIGKEVFVAGKNDIVISKNNLVGAFPNKFKKVPDGTKPTEALTTVDIEDEGVETKKTTPSSKKKTSKKKSSNPLGINVTSKFITEADSTLKVYKKEGKYTVIDSSMEGDDAKLSDEPLDIKGVRSLLEDLVEA